MFPDPTKKVRIRPYPDPQPCWGHQWWATHVQLKSLTITTLSASVVGTTDTRTQKIGPECAMQKEVHMSKEVHHNFRVMSNTVHVAHQI